MSESVSHRRAKRKAAGKSGTTEKKLPGGRRLDASTRRKAAEIELSGNFRAAAERLKASRKPQKVMVVRQPDMKKAAAAMRKAGVGGSVRNIKGTKRISIPKP